MDFEPQGEAAVASAVENLDKETPSSAGFSVAVAVQSGDLHVCFHSPEEHHGSKFRDLLKPYPLSNQLPFFVGDLLFDTSASPHFSSIDPQSHSRVRFRSLSICFRFSVFGSRCQNAQKKRVQRVQQRSGFSIYVLFDIHVCNPLKRSCDHDFSICVHENTDLLS